MHILDAVDAASLRNDIPDFRAGDNVKVHVNIIEGTRAQQVYGTTEIKERHRHRYEFNPAFRDAMTAKGLVVAATSPDGSLVEMIELKDHPWFLACQFHPEFQSRPNHPHPLFKGFIAACLANLN